MALRRRGLPFCVPLLERPRLPRQRHRLSSCEETIMNIKDAKLIRGGSTTGANSVCKSTFRDWHKSQHQKNDLSFRLARESSINYDVRGGGWNDGRRFIHTTRRLSPFSYGEWCNIGFRIVRDFKTPHVFRGGSAMEEHEETFTSTCRIFEYEHDTSESIGFRVCVFRGQRASRQVS